MRLPIRPPSKPPTAAPARRLPVPPPATAAPSSAPRPGAEQGAGVFLRPRPHSVRAAGAGGERETDDGNGGELERGHYRPPEIDAMESEPAMSGEAISHRDGRIRAKVRRAEKP